MPHLIVILEAIMTASHLLDIDKIKNTGKYTTQ